MHQGRKGKQWYFGIKAHIGVDVASGLMHSRANMAAHVADITQTRRRLYGEETGGFWRLGLPGRGQAPRARRLEGALAGRHEGPVSGGARRCPTPRWAGGLEACERIKANIRARMEDPFHVLKTLFGPRMVRYRGWRRMTHSSAACSPSPTRCCRGGEATGAAAQAQPERPNSESRFWNDAANQGSSRF